MNPMMKCGHAANATTPDNKPACAICIGLGKEATEIAETPDLSQRKARCSYGNHADVPSSTNLAFFSHHPNKEFDEYYCGCCGWS